MDFISALGSLNDGYAAKVPSFSGGYVKRELVPGTVPTGYDEQFKIVFVKNSDRSASPTTYEYLVLRAGSKRTVTAPETAVTMDSQLASAIMYGDDWTIGTVTDFESARVTNKVW